MLVIATPYEGYFLCSTFSTCSTTSSMGTMYSDLNRVFMFTTYKSLNMDFDSSCLCMEFCGWYAFMTHTWSMLATQTWTCVCCMKISLHLRALEHPTSCGCICECHHCWNEPTQSTARYERRWLCTCTEHVPTT